MGRSESGDLGSIFRGCWNSLLPFCVALSPSEHWHARYYIAALSELYNFFFLGVCQWWSYADRVVNLNTTILLPLFWRFWSWARARTRPYVLAWHMGRVIASLLYQFYIIIVYYYILYYYTVIRLLLHILTLTNIMYYYKFIVTSLLHHCYIWWWSEKEPL